MQNETQEAELNILPRGVRSRAWRDRQEGVGKDKDTQGALLREGGLKEREMVYLLPRTAGDESTTVSVRIRNEH